MAVDRSYTFPDGTTVELLPVPPLTLEHIVNSEAGKPKPPTIRVGTNRRAEANPDDPTFKVALTAWEQGKQKRVLLYLAVHGVKTDPPEDFMDEHAMYLDPSASFDEMKYLWLASKLPDGAEIARFIEAVTSQTTVTEAAIQEAEDAHFQGDGERAADQDVSLQSTADGEHTDVAGV